MGVSCAADPRCLEGLGRDTYFIQGLRMRCRPLGALLPPSEPYSRRNE